MKISIAQQNYIIGDFQYNVAKISAAINQAKAQNVDMIVFSELALCGYFPEDLLNYKDFMDKCHLALNEIKQLSDGIGVLVGCPSYNPRPEGKNLFNSAYLLYGQEVVQVIHKTLLPTYDIFDEYRYFEPALEWNCINFKGKKLAITICEDIWDLVDDPLYNSSPMDKLMLQNPDVMINLSASPFDYTHSAARLETVRENIKRYHLPLLYCNTVGGQSDVLFDGGSLVLNKNGDLIAEFPYFQEHIENFFLDEDSLISENKTLPKKEAIIPDFSVLNPDCNIENIHDALIMGIWEYFSKSGFKQAVVGSSGGIDSAVVLALACRALGSENVKAILMPSVFSTNHSIDDAVLLSENLGNPYHILPIKQIYDAAEETLNPLFSGLLFNVAEENIQARIRGLLLMAVSNKFGPVLLNTSNKSEAAVGYGTLYGDMAGGLSVLGDLYKTQVYALAKYINKDQEVIPNHILIKPPSAELRPDQKDSDSLPDYPILDALLFAHIEKEKDAQALINEGFDEQLVWRVLKMVSRNEYKRNQFCPILRVSPKSFGKGRRMPLVNKYFETELKNL